MFALLFVVVPLLSFIVRVRRKKARLRGLGGTSTAAGTLTGSASPISAVRPGVAGSVVDVRRRLEGRQSIFGSVWREVTRAVTDTVRMAGGGLV